MAFASSSSATNYMRFLTILIAVTLINACISVAPTQSKYKSHKAIAPLLKQQMSFNETERKLASLVKENKLNATVFENRVAETARIIHLSKAYSVPEAITTLISEKPEESELYIELGLRLFPNSKMKIVEELRLEQAVSEDSIITAAINSGIDPTEILPPTASNGDPIVTPLINSVSVTLFDQTEDTSTEVKFREINSESWKNAFPLAWDPTRSALSGSIVRLEADTDYAVNITLVQEGSPIDEIALTFKTRKNSPPINPNLIYYLSDIYSGEGTLDLELLNIEGAEDGWAKIIGDEKTPIIASELDDYGINIGNKSYVLFENVTVKGGRLHGVYSKFAHHLWFKQCNISKWGRQPSYYRDGKAYEKADDAKPINYDAGFYLFKSGVVVVEDCEVHSPNSKANHWGYGHPSGPTAYLVLANHPEKSYQGQHILRHNKFYGTDTHRFNDVIESRSNGRHWGGFLRDSAIHDNYFAYANDDVIELDGGQSNVLVYNNDIEQGFCGISAVPNMVGPNYIFNNYIHDIGDERGINWAAIKLGGLLSSPAGITHVFNNLMVTKSNGIAQVNWRGDRTYWIHVQNNVIINTFYRYAGFNKGLAVLDSQGYEKSKFINNFFYNTVAEDAYFTANIDETWQNSDNESILPLSLQTNFIEVDITPDWLIDNFSLLSNDGALIIGSPLP